MTPVATGGVLIPKLTMDTVVKKLARAFINVDKYGVKFKDDSVADNFQKQVEKAK